jgi:transposase
MFSGKEKERELIVKLHEKKKTCREIADILGTSKSKVSYWMRRYTQTGKLSDLPRSGRPTKLSRETLEQLYARLRHDELSSIKSGFSSKKVSKVLHEITGKTYCMRHVRRILKKVNITLITPRVSHIRKDENKIKEFRTKFKKNSKSNMWTTNLSPSMK